jgi:hypothetical protein
MKLIFSTFSLLFVLTSIFAVRGDAINSEITDESLQEVVTLIQSYENHPSLTIVVGNREKGL